MARGVEATSAYLRALETGKTLDRRVKVYLIGQDRAGKTSVGKSLKGEKFDANEVSTDGVVMHQPMMNAGILPWKNSAMQEETTTFHHRCAEYISKDLQEQQTHAAQVLISKPTEESSAEPTEIPNFQVKDYGETYEETHGETDVEVDAKTEIEAGLVRFIWVKLLCFFFFLFFLLDATHLTVTCNPLL